MAMTRAEIFARRREMNARLRMNTMKDDLHEKLLIPMFKRLNQIIRLQIEAKEKSESPI